LIDSGCSRHMTGDRRWFSSLTLVMTKEYITFGDNGRGRVLSVGTVKVSEFVTLRHVSLVKSLGTIFSLSPNFLMRILKSVQNGLFSCFGFSRRSCVYDHPRGSNFQSPFFSVCRLSSLFGCWCFGGALEIA
jgi:hypothetical protein